MLVEKIVYVPNGVHWLFSPFEQTGRYSRSAPRSALSQLSSERRLPALRITIELNAPPGTDVRLIQEL